MGVCSDASAGRSTDEIGDFTELEIPVTTDPERIGEALSKSYQDVDVLVVFSTYHSIRLISDAQHSEGAPPFDLMFCDEAHRTTGAQIIPKAGDKRGASVFLMAHDNRYVQAKKRVYMTATPKIWSTKSDNSYQNAEVFSMDDESQFGPVFYRMKFSEAIDKRLLSDYYLVGLTINPAWKNQVSQLGLDPDLPPSEQAKLYGAVKGVAFDENDVPHLRRSLSFTNTIKRSKKHQLSIEVASDRLKEMALGKNGDATPFRVRTQHIDGKTKANIRRQFLDWLKEPEEGECRIVTNARCLSEGVDVPNLDAALFMSPKHSAIDIVQQVGRVMRKSPNKTHGYIVVPILLAEGETATDALRKSEDYATIIKVVRALRSHDDNIDELINQKRFGEKIRLVPVSVPEPFARDNELTCEEKKKAIQEPLFVPDDLIEALNVLVFDDCGDRQYWEKWAKDVGAQTVELQNNILAHLKTSEHARERFDQFMTGIHETMSPNMTELEAAGMLAQHLVTQPVFDAFFENYEFSDHNPVSQILNDVIEEIVAQDLLSNLQRSLAPFYESVQKRIRGITDPTTRHEVLKELYETFLTTAFPEETKLLGVVYTPIEIVDWLLHSANDVLWQEFGKRLGDRDVEILDPFSGTGTFLTRLIESDIIPDINLDYKYQNELSAVEILPTAYYLSAINIEESYHGRKTQIDKMHRYKPFPGIALGDTFTLSKKTRDLALGLFGIQETNTPKLNEINRKDITVIIGNPPWRAKQRDVVEQNPNRAYQNLDERITNTYVSKSLANNTSSLFDTYIKALRWASDRIESNGIIVFVTNGGWLDGSAASGLRACWSEEFQKIYCYNLRGKIPSATGEGGNVFNVTVSVTMIILIKNDKLDTLCQIFYEQSKDGISGPHKLVHLQQEKTLSNVNWLSIQPDKRLNWINQINENYQKYQTIGDKETKKGNSRSSIFEIYSSGLTTQRDPWAYDSSFINLKERTQKMILFYNDQIFKNKVIDPERCDSIIRWHSGIQKKLIRRIIAKYRDEDFRIVVRRPFFKQIVHYQPIFNYRHAQIDRIYPRTGPNTKPTLSLQNLAICVTGIGGEQKFSALMTNQISDVQLMSNGQVFPLWRYRKIDGEPQGGIFDEIEVPEGYVVEDNILDETLGAYREHYDDDRIEKDDIFYYVYGILHHPTYKSKYRNDLRKGLPRIPKAPEFWCFAEAGRKLGHLHVDYSELDGYSLEQTTSVLFDPDNDEHYRFEKLKMNVRDDNTVEIRVNEHLTLTDIPRRALDYVVNGKSGLGWIVDRYRIHKDTKHGSGIVNDANKLFDDPRDFIKLVKQVVQVSVESVDIIESLPPEFEPPEAG